MAPSYFHTHPLSSLVISHRVQCLKSKKSNLKTNKWFVKKALNLLIIKLRVFHFVDFRSIRLDPIWSIWLLLLLYLDFHCWTRIAFTIQYRFQGEDLCFVCGGSALDLLRSLQIAQYFIFQQLDQIRGHNSKQKNVSYIRKESKTSFIAGQ